MNDSLSSLSTPIFGETQRDVGPCSTVSVRPEFDFKLVRVYPGDSLVMSLMPNGMSTVIGRLPGHQTIQVEDPKVSRQHARLDYVATTRQYQISDLGSVNGTYVNGRSIRTALLNHGDVIRIGGALFVYRTQDDMEPVLEMARVVAKRDTSILILGESGVGKEVLSRYIHSCSGRQGPFVAVNCGAFPKDLAAAELFGHVKGAYSGALEARKGLIASSDRGTLLLDEIGTLPLDLQVLLLRVFEERAVRPVGGDAERPINLRLIAATNAPLEQWAEAGTFRADLLARLQQVTLRIPPLRSRRGDVLPLAKTFTEQAGRTFKTNVFAAELMLTYTWPRNVRELKNLISRFDALSLPDATLGTRFLLQHLQTTPKSGGFTANGPDASTTPTVGEYRTDFDATDYANQATNLDVMCPTERPKVVSGDVATSSSESDLAEQRVQGRVVTREWLAASLEANRGNVAQVARELGTSRSQAYRLLARFGVSRERSRS
jgi:DNA-binding NtrC family response regulator